MYTGSDTSNTFTRGVSAFTPHLQRLLGGVEDLVASLRWCIRIQRRHTDDAVRLCSLLEEIDHQVQFCVELAEMAALGWWRLLTHATSLARGFRSKRFVQVLALPETFVEPWRREALRVFNTLHLCLQRCKDFGSPARQSEDQRGHRVVDGLPLLSTTIASSLPPSRQPRPPVPRERWHPVQEPDLLIDEGRGHSHSANSVHQEREVVAELGPIFCFSNASIQLRTRRQRATSGLSRGNR